MRCCGICLTRWYFPWPKAMSRHDKDFCLSSSYWCCCMEGLLRNLALFYLFPFPDNAFDLLSRVLAFVNTVQASILVCDGFLSHPMRPAVFAHLSCLRKHKHSTIHGCFVHERAFVKPWSLASFQFDLLVCHFPYFPFSNCVLLLVKTALSFFQSSTVMLDAIAYHDTIFVGFAISRAWSCAVIMSRRGCPPRSFGLADVTDSIKPGFWVKLHPSWLCGSLPPAP